MLWRPERVEALSRLGLEVPGIKRFWKNASMKGRMRYGEQEGETVRQAGPRLRAGVVKTRLRNLGPPGLPSHHGPWPLLIFISEPLSS